MQQMDLPDRVVQGALGGLWKTNSRGSQVLDWRTFNPQILECFLLMLSILKLIVCLDVNHSFRYRYTGTFMYSVRLEAQITQKMDLSLGKTRNYTKESYSWQHHTQGLITSDFALQQATDNCHNFSQVAKPFGTAGKGATELHMCFLSLCRSPFFFPAPAPNSAPQTSVLILLWQSTTEVGELTVSTQMGRKNSSISVIKPPLKYVHIIMRQNNEKQLLPEQYLLTRCV